MEQITRRTALAGTAGIAAATALGGAETATAGTYGNSRQNARRIDVHHYAVPAFYKQWLVDRGVTAGGLAIPDWSVPAALEIMDQYEVATSILSISTPGVDLGDDAEARTVARRVNDHIFPIKKVR